MGIELSIDLLPDAKQLNVVDKSTFLLRLHGRIQCIAAYTHSLCTEETLQNALNAQSILLPRRKAVERLLHYVMQNDSACDLVPTPIVASLSA